MRRPFNYSFTLKNKFISFNDYSEAKQGCCNEKHVKLVCLQKKLSISCSESSKRVQFFFARLQPIASPSYFATCLISQVSFFADCCKTSVKLFLPGSTFNQCASSWSTCWAARFSSAGNKTKKSFKGDKMAKEFFIRRIKNVWVKVAKKI